MTINWMNETKTPTPGLEFLHIFYYSYHLLLRNIFRILLRGSNLVLIWILHIKTNILRYKTERLLIMSACFRVLWYPFSNKDGMYHSLFLFSLFLTPRLTSPLFVIYSLMQKNTECLLGIVSDKLSKGSLWTLFPPYSSIIEILAFLSFLSYTHLVYSLPPCKPHRIHHFLSTYLSVSLLPLSPLHSPTNSFSTFSIFHSLPYPLYSAR